MSQRNIAFEFVEKELLGHRQSLSRHHEAFLKRVSSFQDEQSADEIKIQAIQSQIESLTKEIGILRDKNRVLDVEIGFERQKYERTSTELKSRVACLEAVQTEMDKAVQAEMDKVDGEVEKDGAVEKEKKMKQEDGGVDLVVNGDEEGTSGGKAKVVVGDTANDANISTHSLLATSPAATVPLAVLKSPLPVSYSEPLSSARAAQNVTAIPSAQNPPDSTLRKSCEPDGPTERRRSSHVTSIDYAKLENVTKRARRTKRSVEKPERKAVQAGGQESNKAVHVIRDGNSAEVSREEENQPETEVPVSKESTVSEEPLKKKANVNCGNQSENDSSQDDAESGKAEAVNFAASDGKTVPPKTFNTSRVSDSHDEIDSIARVVDAAHVTKKRKRQPKKGARLVGEIVGKGIEGDEGVKKKVKQKG